MSTSPTITTLHRNENFWLPRQVVMNDNLRYLSGHALRMVLFLSYQFYKRREAIELNDWEITKKLSIPREVVSFTRDELLTAKLIGVRAVGKRWEYFPPEFEAAKQ